MAQAVTGGSGVNVLKGNVAHGKTEVCVQKSRN